MLPTPSTSHVSFENVYEPAEDSFLLLDTISSSSELAFLHDRFKDVGKDNSPASSRGAPLVVEVGTGSGVVLAFVTANAKTIFNRTDLATLGTDLSRFACHATEKTIEIAQSEIAGKFQGCTFLDVMNADLLGPIRPGSVDVLIFNPPYVPTETLPDMTHHEQFNSLEVGTSSMHFKQGSHLLSLSYAGGLDGMEITSRLLGQIPELLSPERGVAYILLCAQNKPQEVKSQVRGWGPGWGVETVAFSGKQAGWEKLQILRIWRGHG